MQMCQAATHSSFDLIQKAEKKNCYSKHGEEVDVHPFGNLLNNRSCLQESEHVDDANRPLYVYKTHK